MPIPKPAHKDLGFIMLFIALTPAARAEDFGGFGIDFVHDDNVTRAAPVEQAFAANSSELSLWHGYHWQLADYTGLELTGTFARRQYARFTGLSLNRFGGTAVIRHKTGVGDAVPELSFGTGIERLFSNDGRRDAWRYQFNTAIRERPSERWQWTLGAGYESQDGDLNDPKQLPAPLPSKPGNPFDLHAWQLSLALEWDLTPSSWLNLALSHRKGGMVSSVFPAPDILGSSSALALDPAFGPGVVAYRLDATTNMAALDWNFALTEHSTCYVGVERQLSDGGESVYYSSGILRAGFLHNF